VAGRTSLARIVTHHDAGARPSIARESLEPGRAACVDHARRRCARAGTSRMVGRRRDQHPEHLSRCGRASSPGWRTSGSVDVLQPGVGAARRNVLAGPEPCLHRFLDRVRAGRRRQKPIPAECEQVAQLISAS
jgi:hypothetical protein